MTPIPAERLFFTLLGALIGAVAVGLMVNPPTLGADDAAGCAQLERQWTAYRHCLQTAGKMGCRMSPDDFIDYYDVKYRLEQCDGATTD